MYPTKEQRAERKKTIDTMINSLNDARNNIDAQLQKLDDEKKIILALDKLHFNKPK